MIDYKHIKALKKYPGKWKLLENTTFDGHGAL